jgi:hypothetical protein
MLKQEVCKPWVAMYLVFLKVLNIPKLFIIAVLMCLILMVLA